MKIKYKRIIILISMSIMGIALLTFSIPNKKDKIQKDKEQATETTTEGSHDTIDNNPKEDLSSDIKRDVYPEINELVEKYLKAVVMCDVNTLKELVGNPDNIDLEKLQKESEYIEDYRNIECYTKMGYDEGSYIVYVYEELKIIDINTLAPGMRMLYVKSDEDGNIYIYNDVIESNVWDYIQEAKNSSDVQDLIKVVDTKFEEAISSDPDLKAFQEKLNSVAQ